jgi:RNA-directed DNA polymerase
MENSKPYKIPTQTVWIADKKVKANKGSAGADGMDFGKYEENLKDTLYKLWNRMSSGWIILASSIAPQWNAR